MTIGLVLGLEMEAGMAEVDATGGASGGIVAGTGVLVLATRTLAADCLRANSAAVRCDWISDVAMFCESVTFELALIGRLGLGAGVELSSSERRVRLWEFMAVYSSMGPVLRFALYMEFRDVAEPESKIVCTVPFGIRQGI